MRIFAQFPGQGSQKVGMGKELSETEPLARELFAQADEALGFSLSQICFEGPLEKLTLTEIAQPAILTVGVICFELFKSKCAKSYEVVAAAGHSLGEYSALVAAGALSFADAVRLVNRRGRYMQEAVPPGAGKMVAVLGKSEDDISAAIATLGTAEVQIANVNAPGQIVIAGAASDVDRAVQALGGAKTIELQVSAPFHCGLMKPAELRLAEDLAKVNFTAAKFPVYANYSGSAVTQPEEIRDSLRQQVCGRVRWISCVENALRETSATHAVEFGYGNVLSGMLKRIQPAVPRLSVDSAAAVAAI